MECASLTLSAFCSVYLEAMILVICSLGSVVLGLFDVEGTILLVDVSSDIDSLIGLFKEIKGMMQSVSGMERGSCRGDMELTSLYAKVCNAIAAKMHDSLENWVMFMEKRHHAKSPCIQLDLGNDRAFL